MTIDDKDFKEYDAYKNVRDSSKILKRITKDKPIFNTIYYWDNSASKIMIETDLENYTQDELISKIEKLKKAHQIFKTGYLVKNMLQDTETFNLLKEYISLAAFRYSLINRKPFILLQVKYNKLDEFEIKCIFEYIIHTNLYLNANKHKDPIVFVKLGWWTLKDIIKKYEPVIKTGVDDYSYEGNYSW